MINSVSRKHVKTKMILGDFFVSLCFMYIDIILKCIAWKSRHETRKCIPAQISPSDGQPAFRILMS